MNPNIPLVPANKITDKLDQGCYHVYKVFLLVYLVLSAVSIVVLLTNSGFTHNVTILTVNILSILFPIAFIILQYQAITQRNIKKSKIAIGGFIVYMIAYFIASITVGLAFHTPKNILIGVTVTRMLLFYLLIIFGALKVYDVLKSSLKNSDNNYSNYSNC